MGVKNEYKAMGEGIKEGLKGLNTTASPKKRKVCILLILLPLILFIVLFALGISSGNDKIASVGLVFGLCLGLYQFYVGKFKKGLIYTVTIGGLCIGALIDLFKLVFTKTFRDSNNFPIIY